MPMIRTRRFDLDDEDYTRLRNIEVAFKGGDYFVISIPHYG